MNIVDKLREWQRGEREWDQADMVREVLEHLEYKEILIDRLSWAATMEARHD